MAKEFKTFAQLIELLESRGVTTDATTVDYLRRESYYAVINGYIGSFLDKKLGSPRLTMFLERALHSRTSTISFCSIENFDNLHFPILQEQRPCLITPLYIRFCNEYRTADAYLNRCNYVASGDLLVPKAFRGNKGYQHSKNLAELL